METIKNKKEASEFLNTPENEIFNFHKFDNREWKYKDKEQYEHLFRKINGEWIELTENVKAIYVDSYYSGDWEYMDEEYNYHKFNKNNKLLKKIKI